jgi:hypothetical protein
MVESRICSDTGRQPEGLLEELEVILDDFDHGQELYEIAKRSGMEYRFGVMGARSHLTVSRRAIL